MIDKVTRMRMADRERENPGRFGIDNSELLNYELHKTNKTRDNYMNHLSYGYVRPSTYDFPGGSQSQS
jgi:hypothetical protein